MIVGLRAKLTLDLTVFLCAQTSQAEQVDVHLVERAVVEQSQSLGISETITMWQQCAKCPQISFEMSFQDALDILNNEACGKVGEKLMDMSPWSLNVLWELRSIKRLC